MKSVTLLTLIAMLAVGCASVVIRQDVDEWTPKLTAKTAEAIVSSSPIVASNVTVYAASSRFDIAGHYVNGGGLYGYDFHLFSDGTYFFAFWADTFPMHIVESGRWRIKRDFILLSLEKNYDPGDKFADWRADRKYFLLKKETDIFLMGNHYWFSLFVHDCHIYDVFGKCSFRRETEYTRFTSPIMKAKLILDSWEPWLTDEDK